jgi:hypothetical protein
MSANLGYCYIPPRLLADALPLPVDTKIVGAEWDNERQELLLLVQHQDFPHQEQIPGADLVVKVEARESTAYDRITTKVARWQMI